VDNAASRRVMEKVGFRHVETKDGTVRYALDVMENRGN
jgi:RimJ/RimL family protein N-acetyltransferase